MTALDVIAGRAGHSCESGPTLPWLRTLPSNSVHAVVTSPPYFGLRAYLDAAHPDKRHELGTEPTPAEYVAGMVEVFEECRRVLHPSGVFWLNIGDSYASKPVECKGVSGSSTLAGIKSEAYRKRLENGCGTKRDTTGIPGVKEKDLIGIPWLLAFALRDAGWWLRAECIWAKPNGMTESITDRPTRAHEQTFLFAKRKRYFFDSFATRTKSKTTASGNAARKYGNDRGRPGDHKAGSVPWQGDTALLRSVWSIPVARSKGDHFAVMPTKLAARCILAGSSERGVCPACGEPLRRLTERTRIPTRPGADTKATGDSAREGNRDPQRHVTRVEHVGWEPGCKCDAGEPIPSIVLDPFAGSGTTLAVAVELNRRAIGIDLNAGHAESARKRIAGVTPTLIGA